MKLRRFFCVFLPSLLLLLTAAPGAALAEDGEKRVEDPDIQAKAALLIDRQSGAVLYEKNRDQRLFPASLTKIMTALLVLEAVDDGQLSLSQEVTASAFATLSSEGSPVGLKAGEAVSVADLLDCILVVSANEACNVLAEAVSGTVEDFVALMNRRAEELGCENTHFANATGLHDPQHYTTAWDTYLITREALTHDELLTISDTATAKIPSTNLSPERTLHTMNSLLDGWRATGYRYQYAHGIKTGSTTDAGYCLASVGVKDRRSFLCIILGAEKRTTPTGGSDIMSFSEAKRLFEWGFDSFDYQTVLTDEEMLASMPVTLSEQDAVALHSKEDVELLLPNVLTAEDLTRTIRFRSKSVEAPVKQGTALAEVELSYGDTVYATVPLVALAEVEVSQAQKLQSDIRAFWGRTSVRIACAVIFLLAAAAVGWRLTVGRRRYRYGKSVGTRRNYKGRRKH